MAVLLSDHDLVQLGEAIVLLVSPLAHPDADGWRRAVNRALLPLMEADSAGFLLPGTGSAPMFSEQHDEKELAAFPALAPPPVADGTPIWDRFLERRVSTLAAAYDHDMRPYHDSAYYNEYAAPNGARETVAAGFPILGAGPGAAASLHFWHRRLDGRRVFGEREVAMLRLLFPAFRAGVETFARLGGQRAVLLQSIDDLGESLLAVDRLGNVLHQTPALDAMLCGDPQGAMLLSAMRAQAAGVFARSVVGSAPPSQTTSTASARYRIQSSMFPDADGQRESMVLVALLRLTRRQPSAEDLRATFGLTASESRVALQLSEGISNKEVARNLGISPHTARRHTERVLRKLGVRSRAEVSARLHVPILESQRG